MGRPSLFRRIGAALALTLLIFSAHADAYAKAHCAHHGLPSPHSHHHGPQKQHGPCTCLGDCAAATVAIVTPVQHVEFAAPVIDVDAVSSPPSALRSPLEFLLPFSTAPPFLRS